MPRRPSPPRVAAASLTALDERLEEALQASDIGVWEWDLTTGDIRVSSAVGPLYGLPPGAGPASVQRFVIDHVHPEDRPKLDEALDLLVGQERPADLRFRAVTAEGDERLLAAHARLVRDREGRPLRLVGVVHDAGYGERRFRDLADSAPVLMWATGPDLGCTFFNASYLRFTGRRMEDELGEGWRDLVHPDDRALIREADERAEEGRAPFEARYRLRRHDGVYRWMYDRGVPVFGSDGSFEGLTGGMVDLHDLVERDVMLDGIFAGAPVGLALFDPDLRHRRVNDAYAAITGRGVSEHIGRTVDEVIPGIAETATAMLRQVLRTAEPASGVLITAQTAEGEAERRFEASYIPLVLPGGEIAGLAAMVTEVTDRHEAEQRKLQLVHEARAAEQRADESRALLETLLERAPVGFAYLDRDLRFVLVNGTLAEITGQTPEEHLGKRLDEVLPAFGPAMLDDVREVFETGRALSDVEMTSSSPGAPLGARDLLVSLYRVRIPDRDTIALGVTVVEITQRRRAEEELRGQRDLYETLLRAQSEAGEAFALIEGDRITYANDAAEGLTGRTIAELRDLGSYIELVARPRRDDVIEVISDMIAGRTQQTSFETEVQRPDGTIIAVEIAARSLRSVHGVQLVALGRDVSGRKAVEQERERLLVAERSARREIEAAHARATFLSGVSETLARSQRMRDGLHEVAELAIRDVADVIAIDVIPRHGDALERVAVAALDSAARREMRRTLGHMRSLAEDHATVLVALDGVSRWVRDADAERLERSLGFGDLDERLSRACRIHAFGMIPLIARDSVVGVLSLGWQRGRAEPGGLERELIEDLARRIALWIDNTQLYQERAEVASTLQTALLPPELPEIEGIELAALYLPADEASEVGGDFYDVFRAGPGWGVLVGDVCGKGAKAAAATALARYTVRASFAAGFSGPAQAFGLLDTTMIGEGEGERFVTAVLGVLTRVADGRFTLRLACGGHPAPIVLRAGGTREIVEPEGRVIGVHMDGGWDEAEVSLEAGDAVLLYTDGVTEADRRESLDAGELADLLPAGAHALDASELAGLLERVARERGGERLRDDVAVIALKVAPD